MNSFRIALVVPNYGYPWDDDGHCRLSELTRLCHARDLELVVFPEAYEYAECDPQQRADEWASYLRVPVLVGVEFDGFQLAAYRNQAAAGEETKAHLYVKHSTATKLAYEWPGYAGARDAMFSAIRIKDERLGVEICHDMYYGLIGHRLGRAGARTVIDLTAGNVNLAKWRNIVRARSLETGHAFLCTMGLTPGENGASSALGYRRGRCLVPVVASTGSDGAGGFVVIDIAGAVERDLEGEGQAFTHKVYRDITLSLGTGRPAEVVITWGERGLDMNGPHRGAACGMWQRFDCAAGSVGVLPLPLTELANPIAIHRIDAPQGEFDHVIVVYYSREPPPQLGDVLDLMKLRAIEHRAGIALLAGSVREVLKTNRYKNIQRFRENEGVFGLNAEFLGGTWSTLDFGSGTGIPPTWFPAYRSLLST